MPGREEQGEEKEKNTRHVDLFGNHYCNEEKIKAITGGRTHKTIICNAS